MIICPVCEAKFDDPSFSSLSSHFNEKANTSDTDHVMWLNRNISKKRMEEEELALNLENFFDYSKDGIANWIRRRFVNDFFSSNPHPFIAELQHPTPFVIMGYVTEHYHFLKQWVKSCAYIIAKTDYYDVQKYEIDNISEEYFGQNGELPHIELLLRMGESVGLSREKVVKSIPLPKTADAINFWERIARDGHWLDAMASLHSLELIADKNIKDYGAKYSYFDPGILISGVTSETASFLKAGYDADYYHSSQALNLVEKYAVSLGRAREVQSYFLISSWKFYNYLNARLERGKMYEKEL